MEFEKETRSWVVGSITRFQSFYFHDALARMMLEPTLPATSILSSEDENFIRKLLYDATVLVDYSFLRPERTIHLPAKPVTSLALRRLITTHKAIEFFRKASNQKRAISCSSSYSRSRLHSQIVECITNQIGSTEEASRLNGSSAKSLIKWLQALEGHGVRLFDDSISKHLGKLYLDDSKYDLEQAASKLEGNKDLLFYIDNKGDEKEVDEDPDEANESLSAAFVAAARPMSSAETVATKRKEGDSSRKKKRAKLLKYDHSEDSDSNREGCSSAAENDDCLNTESEVENPTSDEEV